MLRIRKWARWQRAYLYDVTRKRKPDSSKPYAMQFFALAANLDDDSGNFREFVRLVGGRTAEVWLVRTLAYLARNNALVGVIRVQRDNFGARVLSTDWDEVSKRIGCEVYDALIASGICDSISQEEAAKLPGELAGKLPGDDAGQSAGELAGNKARSDGDGDGEEDPPNLPVPGRDTSSASPSDQRTAKAIAVLREVVAGFVGAEQQDAEAFRDSLEAALRFHEWETTREVEVPERGDGNGGRIDLVVTAPALIGIECDRKSPREKSVTKLRQFVGARVVVLRERPDKEIKIPGILVLVAGKAPRKTLPEGVAMHGGYVPNGHAAAPAVDPAAKVREIRDALLHRPPPAEPMRGPDVEPEPRPRVADQGKIERLKAETLAKIAVLEQGEEEPGKGASDEGLSDDPF